MNYFRHYWEQPDDSGTETVTEDAPEETTDAAVEAPETPPEAPSFTPEDDARDFGPRFQERFAANHDPATARREYARSVEHLQSAYGRLSRGGEATEEDIAHAEALGVDLPTPQEEEEDAPQPLWGAPWAEPTDYESFVKLAETRPDKAMVFIDKQPEGVIDPDTRQQVLNYWAQHEQAAAISYERGQARQQAIDEAKRYADEQVAAMRLEFGDVRQKYETDTQAGRIASVDLLANRARTEIPDFAEHEKGVIEILKGYVEQDPTYLPRLLGLPPEQQLQHISDITGAAAWRNRPQAAAEAEAERAAAEAAKVGAACERGSGASGSSGGSGSQSEMKKKHLADIQAALKSPV